MYITKADFSTGLEKSSIAVLAGSRLLPNYQKSSNYE